MGKVSAAKQNDLCDIFIKWKIPHKWPRAAVTRLLEMLWLLRIKDQSGNNSDKIHPSIHSFCY